MVGDKDVLREIRRIVLGVDYVIVIGIWNYRLSLMFDSLVVMEIVKI